MKIRPMFAWFDLYMGAYWNKERRILYIFPFPMFGLRIEFPLSWRRQLDLIYRQPIHDWFELSYAQYLTIPRSVLQSMPVEWQERFVQCLKELDDRIDWRPSEGRQYKVTLHLLSHREGGDGWGYQVHDPLMDYERGRRRIPMKETRESKEG